MRSLIHEIQTAHTPESLVAGLRSAATPGIVLLRTALFESSSARYSLVTANPFLTFRSFGSACEIIHHPSAPVTRRQFGNPWHLLEALMARYELLEDVDLPFPLGGGFGYWGYELKNFTEPKLPRRAGNDLALPDCHVGFYDSLAVFDHQLGKTFVVATGLKADGARTEAQASAQFAFWQSLLAKPPPPMADRTVEKTAPVRPTLETPSAIASNLSRAEFIARSAAAISNIGAARN